MFTSKNVARITNQCIRVFAADKSLGNMSTLVLSHQPNPWYLIILHPQPLIH
jgi:hypothetical protein